MKIQFNNLDASWQTCLLSILICIAITIPEMSFAQADTPMGDVLCTIGTWFTGNTGKGLAVIAVIIIGIGCLMGKISWGIAITVGANIAVVFGAAGIVDALGASTPPAVCDINVAGNHSTAISAGAAGFSSSSPAGSVYIPPTPSSLR